MSDTKRPYQSKSLIGAGLLMVAAVANQLGVDISPAEQVTITNSLASAADEIVAVFGWLMVIWGRLTASKKISW